MTKPNFLTMTREGALSVLQPFIASWDAGGAARSLVAIDAAMKSEGLAEAPKTTGWLWWKRATTEDERRAWVEREMALNGFESDLLYLRMKRHRMETQRLDGVEVIRSLMEAVEQAPAGTAVHINSEDWRFAHSKF